MASRRMKKKWLNEGLLLLLPCHQAIIQRELGSTGRFKDTCRQPDQSPPHSVFTVQAPETVAGDCHLVCIIIFSSQAESRAL